jgi:hypothetical protein
MKCPACDQPISTALCESIQIQASGFSGYALRGVAYLCPVCRAALSVNADPLALVDETVARIKKLLK